MGDVRDEGLAAIVRFLEADEDVPDALVEKGAEALREVQDSWGESLPDSETRMRVRTVLRAVLPDVTDDLRARLKAADDRLAEVRREVAESAWDAGYLACYAFERGDIYPEPVNPHTTAHEVGDRT